MPTMKCPNCGHEDDAEAFAKMAKRAQVNETIKDAVEKVMKKFALPNDATPRQREQILAERDRQFTKLHRIEQAHRG